MAARRRVQTANIPTMIVIRAAAGSGTAADDIPIAAQIPAGLKEHRRHLGFRRRSGLLTCRTQNEFLTLPMELRRRRRI
jgi:hypothetical protein